MKRQLWIPLDNEDLSGDLEAIVSIVAGPYRDGILTLLCGSRNGLVITLLVNEVFELTGIGFDKLGSTQAIIKRDENPHPADLFFHSRQNCVLVVAAIIDSRSTILMIDADTGEDLCLPIDHATKKPTASIRGLGNMDEKIYHLMEWPFVKNNKAWYFIIITTSTGRLLIISAVPGPPEGEIGKIKPAMAPKIMMHVDGDVLKRCLDEQHLEHLLRIGHETEDASKIFSKFYELLQELHGGSLEAGKDPDDGL
ncbi:hypothetical protein M7I_1235 [Glarea lozoyensis 74030]|uniref:Uncharacterized protein n=1 Tax=Glarea lozoyensis (strain ATCC 74030 / MF5533) TaxID=1104152 RepID=H0EFG1_GLAL7|nr:hypothetical protein M7I_1235 [Glarea lozoyensis 74030]